MNSSLPSPLKDLALQLVSLVVVMEAGVPDLLQPAIVSLTVKSTLTAAMISTVSAVSESCNLAYTHKNYLSEFVHTSDNSIRFKLDHSSGDNNPVHFNNIHIKLTHHFYHGTHRIDNTSLYYTDGINNTHRINHVQTRNHVS